MVKGQTIWRAAMAMVFVLACGVAEAGDEKEPRSDHWAFQPISRPVVRPDAYHQRVRNAIDVFVFNRLSREGIVPRPEAARRVLHRRLAIDLLGISPTPSEQERFESDSSPDAYERLVDRLLARPEFGERWARHWLDVARYGESNGYERDGTKPNAWRYRDYAIQSFNSDLPFDRFVTEQLAGDEIPGSNSRTQIATTFLRLGTWDDEPADPFADRYDQLDDVLGTTSAAFLGLTLRCARCHDHKFEPLSQRDYYGILAVFTPLKRPEKIKSATHREEYDREVGSPAELASYRQQIKRHDATMAALGQRRDAVRREVLQRALRPVLEGKSDVLPPDVARAFLVEPAKRSKKQEEAVKANAKSFDTLVSNNATESELRELSSVDKGLAIAEASKPPKPPRAYIWYEDSPKAPSTKRFERGDPYAPREAVEPGVPVVLGPRLLVKPEALEHSTGRRLWLARWMTSRDNPLVSRVFVNRVWQHMLGDGLVTTESDFGEMGDVPFHQDLLDWLASDFQTSGWQVKRLVRLIALSSTYRMDSLPNPEAKRRDQQERLLWRFRQRRIDAEAFRDSVLAVTGSLNDTMYGASVYPTLPQAVLEGQSRPGDGWGKATVGAESRRSVYIFSKRSLAVPELALLDAPNSTDSCAQRAVSTTGPQALTFLNGAFMNRQSKRLAQSITSAGHMTAADQVAEAFRRVLCRPASADELRESVAFLTEQARLRGPQDETSADAQLRALGSLCLVLLNTNEFAYIR